MLIVDVIVGRVISGFIVGPLSRLREASEQVARGNYDIHLDKKSDDEFGLVADAFNEMVDKVKSTIKGLDEVKKHAERMRIAAEKATAATRETEERRCQLQEKLEAAQRLESLGALAGGVAHDLKNMLGPLVGYPDLILANMPKDNPARKYVMRTAKSAIDSAEVVQNLLALARRGRYEMHDVDLNSLIREFLDSPNFESLSAKHEQLTLKTELSGIVSKISGSRSPFNQSHYESCLQRL